VKKAELYREFRQDHICPFGAKAKYLLERKGFEVVDHHLKSKEEAAAFRDQHKVKTTPQTFIDGNRVGGYDDLRKYFGLRKLPGRGDITYQPVIALFGVALLIAAALYAPTRITAGYSNFLAQFVAISMCLLALQKLKDVEGFSNGFLNYDLLSRRWLPYAYIYPYVELFAGVSMLGNLVMLPAGILSLLIGLEGGLSVVKAVYIEKRSLKCSCVGGDSNVPLGFISLMENLMMAGMGIAAIYSSVVGSGHA
jgi:glutaredoxin